MKKRNRISCRLGAFLLSLAIFLPIPVFAQTSLVTFPAAVTPEILLTPDELAYAASLEPLRVAGLKNRFPISYFDEQTGEYQGVSADVMRLISEMTGLRFVYLPAQDSISVLDRMQAGSIDLACGMPQDITERENHPAQYTASYLTTPLVRISSNKPYSSNRIALSPAYANLNDIAQQDGREVLFFADLEECFEALRAGEASTTYANSYTANHLLSDPRYAGFSAITLLGKTDDFCITVSAALDPMVAAIISKAVQEISPAQLNDLILANTTRPRPVTLRNLFYQNPQESLWIISIFFLLVFGVLVGFLIYNSRFNRKINRLLYEDPLTGMWNFNKFRLKANALFKSDPQQRAVIYLDIDKFKYINDSYGYARGDEILCSFAQMLRQFVEEGEMFSRISADHFVLLLKMPSRWELDQRLQQLRIRLEEVSHDQENHLWFIVMGGICVLAPGDSDLTTAIDWANFAKETITDAHQTTLVYYSDTIRDNLKIEKTLEQRMESALAGQEFIPFLQPKVDIFSRQVVGAEALVRWIGQDGKIVSPAQFIPLFERNGFVVQMDLFIFGKVCGMLREWLDQGRPVVPVACNFSRLHLRNPAFPEILQQIAADFEIDPGLLELEITESVAMENAGVLEKQIRRLADMGFKLAIDDFGTGYSSLGILQMLPVDVLKLDKVFIDKGFLEAREREVLSGIVQIARNLDMQVVCEGVETEQQLEILRQIGCRVAQGYFYARPMPRTDFEQFLDTNRSEFPIA